jgi:PAS domain S-box-containing protein
MSMKRILIVEDEVIVARDIEERLLALGYESAGIANTAEEALAAAALGKPALALMDIRIRGDMDGITTAQELSRRFGIPSVFLTAYSDDSTLARVKELNPYGYILKPFDDRDLKSGIELALFRSEAEARVRVSEMRFASAFEYAAIGMALVSPEGQWLKVNRSLCDILGYSEGELLGGRFQDITVPEDLPSDLEFVRRMLVGEIATYQMEKRYRRRDGQVVWALLSVSLVRDTEGKPVHFVSQIQDITGRKEAEHQRTTMLEILEILNTIQDLREAAMRLIGVIQRETGIEAIAIRTAKGGDFTYLAHMGFPKEFVDAEDHLCAIGRDGSPLIGPDGKPRLECTCGLILEGRLPKGGSTSPGGSVWTNDPASVAPVPDGGDPRLNPRNLCIKEGYKSIALIPIRSGSGVLGLLQLNDPRPGQFSEGRIAFLERLTSSIGIALNRRQAEERLRHSLAHLGLTLDAAKAGTWEWDLQTNENMWSESLWKLYGLDPATDQASYDSWRKVIHPEDRDRAEQTVQKAARDGAELNAEWRVRLPGGEIRWLASRGKPLKSLDGRVERFLGMVMDVTEHRDAESKLIELKVAVEQASDGIAISDMEGVIRFVNKTWAEMHGLSPEATLGKSLTVFHTGAQWKNEVQPHLSVLRQQGHYAGDVWHMRADGSEFPAFMSTSVLKTPSGVPYGMLAIAHDITEQRKAEGEQRSLQAQLVEAQKMESIGRLAGGVAHDFNNSLYCVLGFSELILEKLDAKSPLRSDVEQILQAANQAADVTRQLLAFSRRQVLQPGPTDLDVLIVKQQKMLHRIIGEDIKINLDLKAGVALAIVDPSQFQQVLINLCVNARDAMPQGGPLVIASQVVKAPPGVDSPVIKAGAPVVKVSVIDKGVGMPPEIIDRIFEPFFTTKELGKGTGLGLSVVMGVVKQHGGWVEVASKPGAGTRFDVFLPCAEVTPVSEDENKTPLPRGHGECILLVEDDPIVRQVGATRLKNLGYKVIEAEGVESGWAHYRSAPGPVRVLLSDVVLSDGSGVTLAERIAADDPSVRIAFSSGYADERSRVTEISARHWSFITKPYNKLALAQLIDSLLKGDAG